MLQYKENGLIPAIVQDANNGEVLMLGYMNEESIRLTREYGQVVFYSRSRQEIWHKGATSGNFLNVREMKTDCDLDAILIKADPVGPVCHTGARACFFNEVP